MGRKRKEESVDVTKLLEETPFRDVGDVTALLDGPESDNEVETTTTAAPPDKFTPEWHDYVMGMFTPDELMNGNPTTDGLRRVAQQLNGAFDSTNVEVMRCDREHAVIKYSIIFDNYGVKARYEDIAECHFDNTDPQFQKYLVATTTTRAEGRVLRKLLGLKKVIAAEEVTEDALFADNSNNITGGQIVCIDRICSRNNINLLAFVNSGATKYQDIAEVPKATALKMIEQLNVLQNDRAKIKPELTGYNANWRTSD